MAFSIGELVGVISLNDQFSAPMKGIGKEVGKAGESFNAIAGFAGIAASAVVGATSAIVALGQRGAEVADVQGAFDNLSAAVGSTGDAMLGALQQGTLGTISNFDLMSSATGVLGSGLVKSAEDMATLAAGAQMLADRTGGDTAQAFDTLSGAMASGRTNSLKALGLFVDTDAAVRQMAASLGKSVKDLTDQEVAQAKANATLAALKTQLDAAGPSSADFGDQITRGKVAVENFVDALGVAIATSPVVAAGMDAIKVGFESAFGGNQQEMVKTLMGYVNDFAIGLTYLAEGGAIAAGVLVTAWYAVKTAILGVMTVSAAQTAVMAEVIAKVLEFAASVPGMNEGVKEAAASARGFADDVRGMTVSLAEQTAEAAKGVVGNTDLHRTLEGIAGGAINARAAMEAAATSTEALGETATTTIVPVGQLNETLTLTAEQIKAIEDQTRESLEYMNESWGESVDLQAELQNEITLLQTTGIQQRLLEMELARQTEIAGLQHLAFEYPLQYEAIVAMVTEKYRLMADIATGANLTIAQAAANAGYATQASLDETAQRAYQLWADMVKSGQFTAKELEKAFKDSEKAKQAAAGETSSNAMENFQIIAGGASSLLRTVFGKNKAAAIAAAIIDTAAAVAKSLASLPWPASLVPAAAALAAGVVQINKIRSTDANFATGTPGTQFMDFGRVSAVNLHGREAVVTPRQGASVAAMVEDALAIKDTRLVDELRGLRAEMAADRRALPIYIRDAALLAAV